MRIRNRRMEMFLPSDFNHWCIYFSFPNENSLEYPEDTYRLKLMIGFWRFFLALNLWRVQPLKCEPWSLESKQYGITFFERGVHFHWGKTYVKDLPWAWQIVRWDLLLPDGSLYNRTRYPQQYPVNDVTWFKVLEYKDNPHYNPNVETRQVKLRHVTKNGEVQEATIRLAGQEMEWRWKWATYLPWPRLVKRTVDCQSDIELGERAGSWKGGLMGWGYEWKKGETLEEAFWNWYKGWNRK
jgi:hypothetical protein